MVDPTYPLFPIFAVLGFALVLVPLPWHWEAWNSATCYYMLWTSLSCFNQFINSVVWAKDAIDHAPAWCEISTRITIAASVGIPAAAMCINQRLYSIARAQAVMITKAEKGRAVIVDTLICVLFPVIIAALSYIVQGHRYNVLEQLGCFPALYNTSLTYFLVDWWPLLLGVIASVYCVLSLLAFNKRRAQFNEFLSSKKSSLTLSRYFRLMALSTTSLLLLIPISSYGIYLNTTTSPLGKWISWSDTHFDFGRIEQIPAIVWRASSTSVIAHELNRWLSPACALIFFVYFGIASEARRHYRTAFWFVVDRVGRKISLKSEKTGLQSLGKYPSPTKFASQSESLPAYDYPRPSYTHPTSSFTTSFPSFADEKPFSTYQGLASMPSLIPASGSTTPIYDHFARGGADGTIEVVPPLPPFPNSPPHSPNEPSAALSPTDSMFSHDSEQSAVSLSFTDIEAAYGARVLSFVSLEIEQSSEPPTPLNLHHVTS
ncbi:STE3-domain-containing protein [Dichomitus squalens LYAD-421 SS1]|uniref:STE3-domain-containing protein n=1 Tax=Dichomitus squalens (strain LYAD-421) TaxID=732165 RepID=R7SSD5_DICSQ|nr:STE3-domain-containing protein [Dichomitus squalens LYAD-421 SS1]EJF59104.1 STE3-domain-containing protein [Dichomitus squalens LYAD-421 SS1]